MAILFLIKLGTVSFGLMATMGLFIRGLVQKDSNMYKRAGLVFMAIWVMVLLIGAMEFFLI